MANAAGLPKRPPAANDIKPHVTKTFKVSHDPALVEKFWDVIGLRSLRRTAFLAEKVVGNVVSSGVKVLVLVVMIDIGSTIFGQFARGFNSPPTIDTALTLILAAVVLLELSILEPLRIVPSLADQPGADDLAVGTPFEAAIGLVGHQDLADPGDGEGIGKPTKHEYR